MLHARPAVLLTLLGAGAFLLAAFAGCKGDSGSSTGVPTSITVTGKVITNTKLPIANSPVVITGRPATVTDANGNFTVTDVTVPYDVTVVVSASKLGLTYRGLSRSDPILVNFLSSAVPTNTATVSGTVSGGGGYPQPATRTSGVSLSSAEVDAPTTPITTTGAYTVTPTWVGAATVTTILRALQWDKNASGMPTTYVGYGEKTGVAITAGGTFAGQNIAMTAISSQNISGTVSVPATVVLESKVLSLTFPNNGSMPLGTENGTATAFTYVVPAITGTALVISALAKSGVSLSFAKISGIAPGTNGIAIHLPDPTALSLPVNAATGVTTTTPFSWTPLPSVVYQMFVFGAANQPNYMVITGGNSSTIPDLSALGLGLPQGTTYTWNITTYGTFANIDSAANGFHHNQNEAAETISLQRTFTTAP